MKRFFYLILVFLSFSILSFNVDNIQSYTVDTDLSKVKWKGYKSTGKHNGVLKFNSGQINYINDSLVGGFFEVDMSTIQVLDSDSQKLLKHLKSEDFFDVEEFPKSSFKINKVEVVKDSLLLSGIMTIKDYSNDLAVPVKIYEADGKKILESNVVTLNREDYNIRYKSNSFFSNMKNNFIKDDFEMQVFVVFD